MLAKFVAFICVPMVLWFVDERSMSMPQVRRTISTIGRAKAVALRSVGGRPFIHIILNNVYMNNHRKFRVVKKIINTLKFFSVSTITTILKHSKR